MKQKIALTIMAWAIGQSGLSGSDLSILGTVVGIDETPLSDHIIVVTSGRVVDASLEPLPNLVVRIRVTGGEVIGNKAALARARVQLTLTNAEGRYEFSGLPAGNATVVATRPGTPSIGAVRELRESTERAAGDATVVDFVIP